MPSFRKKERPTPDGYWRVQKAFKTKLKPTAEQSHFFGGCAGASRFVYNWALNDRDTSYKERGERVSYAQQKSRFNAEKDAICPWIRAYPYIITESAFRDLDSAYIGFFRHGRDYPKYKRRGSAGSFCFGANCTVERDRIKLPVIGWVQLAEPGYIPVAPERYINVTVSERAGDWYVAVTAELLIPTPERLEGDPIGVDFGYGVLATLSDGTKFANPQSLSKSEEKLARLQQKLTRQVRGGANYQKTRSKIAKLHLKIANQRAHELHNVSKTIVSGEHSVIAMQRLAIQEMMQDDSSESKHAKRAKRLADAGLFELRRQITYKQGWAGGISVTNEVDAPTNRRCATCGNVADAVSVALEEWVCPSCEALNDRRVNGAMNALQLAGY